LPSGGFYRGGSPLVYDNWQAGAAGVPGNSVAVKRFLSGVSTMKAVLGISLIAMGTMIICRTTTAADVEKSKMDKAAMTAPLDQEMETLDGKKVNLAKKYKGKVLLLVNVASHCGNTKQYKPLEALHEKYSKDGLAIVGVPCNQFGEQEPGSAKEIAEFCEQNYGVKFDMMAKVDVNGDNAVPLYKYLTSKKTDPKFAGKIPWNFEKFLFNRDGQVVGRFNHRTSPDSKEVVAAIEKELAKKK
jgi:glutathione peroxidase